MKVLLRKYGDKYYVWKSVEWKEGAYYFFDEDGDATEISQTNILAIKEDERVGYVACAHCGKLIKNDPESIEAHYKEEEAKKNCVKCEYLRTSNKQFVDAAAEKNADGTYTVTQTFSASLNCCTNYWSKPIDSEDAIQSCICNLHRRKGVTTIDDVFVKYPGVFEKFITVDTLLAKGCEYQRKTSYFEYDMKLRGTLVACVNEMGIVDHFRLYYRGHTSDLYYSDKYNILFHTGYMCYQEGTPYGVPEKKMEQVKEKIAAFYKEANK